MWKTIWLGIKAKDEEERFSVYYLFSDKVTFNYTACEMVVAGDGNEGLDTDVFLNGVFLVRQTSNSSMMDSVRANWRIT